MSERVFSGAIKTNTLVGRQGELERIRAAIPNPGDRSFHCMLVRAEGGKGKTSLLRAVGTSVSAWELPVDSVVALPLIDVADPMLHSVVAFLEVVYDHLQQQLPPSLLQIFELFSEHLGDYRRARDGGSAYHVVMQRRTDVINAFERAYATLTATARVVWVLDTMEQLFSMAPEIEELLKYELGVTPTEVGPSTFHWLLQFILRRPPNTTVLLAGRPQPGQWVMRITSSLQTLSTLKPADAPAEAELPIEVIDLGNFTYAETLNYIETLRAELGADAAYAEVAEYLAELLQDEPQVRVLFELTEGNPIELALYIDLLVNGSTYPDALRISPEALAEMSEAERRNLTDSVQQALLTYISRQLGTTHSEVLDYLAIMRRGLDVERLVALRGGDHEAARRALEMLSRLSFVKQRGDHVHAAGEPAPERFYLHDELYKIYQLEFAHADEATNERRREYQRSIFKRLIAYTERERRQVIDELFSLLQQRDQADPDGRQYIQTRLSLLRQQQRALQVELLHYNLYLDPRNAFNTIYIELGEQAFSANDPELNDQLQSEIELFFFGGEERSQLNRLQTGLSEHFWDRLRFSVIHERITNATRRLILARKHAWAIRLADLALANHRGLLGQFYPDLTRFYDIDEGKLREQYFRSEWQVYSHFAAFPSSGASTREGIDGLRQIASDLETYLRGGSLSHLPAIAEAMFPSTYRMRMQNLLAQIYMFIGYGHATLSNFHEARAAYQRADFILLVTPPHEQVLHGELKNNLARVVAELGTVNIALRLADDGIGINKTLGLDYRVALGLNTKALIYRLGHDPAAAYEMADQALAQFRQLNEPRGIGLALLQIGDAAHRRVRPNRDEAARPAPPSEAEAELLRRAEKDLAEAEQIFVTQVPEMIRLFEVKLAQANLYRVWANVLGQRPGDDYYERAEAAFKRAVGLAQEHDYQRPLLSALIDQAWFYKQRRRFGEALAVAEQARGVAPDEYELTEGRPLALDRLPDVAVFRELSKLESLSADIAADEGRSDESLRHRILAMVYLQLFSSSESWHLERNADRLYSLVNEMRSKDWRAQRAIGARAEAISAQYGLDALVPRLGQLRFRQVIRDSFSLPDDLDYLQDAP